MRRAPRAPTPGPGPTPRPADGPAPAGPPRGSTRDRCRRTLTMSARTSASRPATPSMAELASRVSGMVAGSMRSSAPPIRRRWPRPARCVGSTSCFLAGVRTGLPSRRRRKCASSPSHVRWRRAREGGCRTSDVGVPPTPNPSPQGEGNSLRQRSPLCRSGRVPLPGTFGLVVASGHVDTGSRAASRASMAAIRASLVATTTCAPASVRRSGS